MSVETDATATNGFLKLISTPVDTDDKSVALYYPDMCSMAI